jgi:Flp pilus assembly protein TadD
MGVRGLPPGRYVARAQIKRGGATVGVLTRPFVLEASAVGRVASSVNASASAKAFAGTLPVFDRQAVLQRDLVASMLDAVERRGATLKDAVVEARAGRYGPAAIEALGAGDQTAAAFLRGLDFYAKGQLDQAVTQLNISAGPRREFFPAALLLGASLAAAGRDRDAAGVWQLAMGTEARPVVVYTMVADARLRDGQPQSAIDILKPAYDRQPGDDEVGRRLAVAYVLTSRYADALPVLDAYLARHPTDQDLLLAAIVAHYEVARGGQAMPEAELGKLRKYAAAYRGPDEALVTKYLQALQAR